MYIAILLEHIICFAYLDYYWRLPPAPSLTSFNYVYSHPENKVASKALPILSIGNPKHFWNKPPF